MEGEHKRNSKKFLIRIILSFCNYHAARKKWIRFLHAANAEIQSLIKKGPSKENLEKVKQTMEEQHKVNIKENGTWLSQLQSFYFPGDNPDYFINYEKYVNALTPKDIQDAAKLLLSTKNVFTGILRPEKQ